MGETHEAVRSVGRQRNGRYVHLVEVMRRLKITWLVRRVVPLFARADRFTASLLLRIVAMFV